MARHAYTPARLRTFLLLLTLLLIGTQLLVFVLHYQVSSLVDSLVNSSLPQQFLYPAILWPLMAYLLIQIGAYMIAFNWLIAVITSYQDFFLLSARQTYFVGIGLWIIAVILLVSLNRYFYPHSFFAILADHLPYFSESSKWLMLISAAPLLFGTGLFYYQLSVTGKGKVIGVIILILFGTNVALAIKHRSLPVQHATSPLPNIIIIGFDSLRPDFVGYFNKETHYTPHIDQFLKTAAVFENHYTPLARTYPSWMSVLTSTYPLHNFARNNLASPLPVIANDQFAKHLQLAGYETIYATDEKRFSNITKNYGFNHIVGPKMGVNDFILGGLTDFPLSNLLVNLPMGQYLFPYQYGNRAAAVTYQPARFIEQIHSQIAHKITKPVFLNIHLCTTHWPYFWSKDQAGFASSVSLYEHAATSVDGQYASLMQMLKSAGLLHHAILILLSDHGTTLGLANDREISRKNYVGDKTKLSVVSVYKLNVAGKKSSLSLNTSYGQGTDVLSLKQNHSLFAIKGYGVTIPHRIITKHTTMMDVAPTLLDLLRLSPMKKSDGQSLLSLLKNKTSAYRELPLFLETGDKIGEIETAKIDINKVISKRINYYTVNPNTGLLSLEPRAEVAVIKTKQRAVVMGNWMLAKYPSERRYQLLRTKKNTYDYVSHWNDPYYVLLNLKTRQWTIGLDSALAKQAPMATLLRELNQFYGKEMQLTGRERS